MNIVKLLIERYSHGDKQTIGNMFGLSDVGHCVFECDTLELKWDDNKQNTSCIPTGVYNVVKRYSKKFKHHLHITDVINREYILIHPSNKYTDIRGCVAVGKLGYVDFEDDIIDVLASKKTMNKLFSLIKSDVELVISNRL